MALLERLMPGIAVFFACQIPVYLLFKYPKKQEIEIILARGGAMAGLCGRLREALLY